MTPDEYEARMRRLTDDTEAARVALSKARSRFEGLCEETYNLRITYHREQLAGEGGAQ